MVAQLPPTLTLALRAAFLLISWHNASAFVHQLPSVAASKPHKLRMAMAPAVPETPKKVQVGYTTSREGERISAPLSSDASRLEIEAVIRHSTLVAPSVASPFFQTWFC